MRARNGTFISGTPNFYRNVHQIFEAAKQNAPSIIFIDDSDVIFEDNDETGLYRYLLTMLDGLESESAGRVCVMLTAMEVSSQQPWRVGAVTRLSKEADEMVAIALFNARYNRVPDTVYVWRGNAYIELREGEK